MKRSLFWITIVALVGLAAWMTPKASDAQDQPAKNIWANPQNLKVLPKDITPEQLRRTMVGAATGLGIRCWGCHVGTEEQDLTEFDFVSDEKKMKALARVMFQMTMDINQNHLPKIAAIEGEEHASPVRCVTCHRGEVKPKIE